MGTSPNTPDVFLDQVQETTRRIGLFSPGDCLLVAVSGGLDSTTLLHVLTTLQADWNLALHVAHLNHGIRGIESQLDAKFVASLSADRGIPFHQRTVDCKEIANARKCSLEEAARETRRDFLREIAGQVRAKRIATGHHRDDQTETVLFRLLRGSGTTGLGGIRAIKDDLWIRPFLGVTRAQIEAYARSKQVEWREDRTNRDQSIPRNRVRHSLIPELETRFGPHVSSSVARAADILQSDDALLESITLDASKTVICAHSERKIALDGPRFFGYHVAIQRRLIRHFLTLAGQDAKRVHLRLIDRILARFRQGPGTVQVSSDLTACYTGRLILLGGTAPVFEEHIGFGPHQLNSIGAKLSVEALSRRAYPTRFSEIDPFEIWFDQNILPNDLVMRTIKPGDRIRPFGGGGSAKVSDVLIDHKIPRLVRDEVPVLANPDEVLWIVGVRASERSRISDSSEQAVRLRFDGSWRQFYSAMKPFV